MKNRTVTPAGNQTPASFTVAYGPKGKNPHLNTPNHHCRARGLAVHQPSTSTPVATEYSASRLYSNRGSWALLETMRYGRIFLVFSIANLTYPRTTLSTSYSLVISDDNQTISNSYISGFGLKVTALTVQDNYGRSTTSWGRWNLTDAAQVATIFSFRTSAVHQLRFTVRYGLYDLFPLGYVSDHSATQSFNVTQSVL